MLPMMLARPGQAGGGGTPGLTTVLGWDDAIASDTLTVTGITCAAGDLITVATIGISQGGVTVTGVSLGAESFTKAVENDWLTVSLWQLRATAAHTNATLTVTFSDWADDAVSIVLKTEGTTATPLDKTAAASGTYVADPTPDSGPTATLAQASEVAICVLGTYGAESLAAGTWLGGVTALARHGDSGNGCCMDVAYKVTTTTDGVSSAKVDIGLADWGALVATYKLA